MSTLSAFDLRRPAPVAPFSATASERAVEQLPIPLTSFVGRERETAAIRDLLLRPEVRLLTLTGPGGVGKTRLALRVLPDLQPVFPGGVWFVELAPVADPAHVLPVIAATLGARNPGGRRFVDLLAATVGDARTLLALDNFEHVVGAAHHIAELLAACPGLTVLVTSRVSLRLGGEHLFAVQPLSLAPGDEDAGGLGGHPPNAGTADPASHRPSPAVTLFGERARAIRPEFAITDANLATLDEICRQLDGLPLAIELAAARTRVLSPAALLLRLSRRLNVLTGGPRDLPDRQRTLRDTIAWSYDLLLPGPQALLMTLSVFAGGFTVETAEALVAPARDDPSSTGPLAIEPDRVLDHLTDLVDGGLVRQDEQPGGDTRFRMLETVREYALERLEATGQEAAVRSRHAALFADLAARANLNEYRAGEAESLTRLGLDLDNIRAALGWSLRPDASAADVDVALRLAGGTERYFLTRGYIAEGRAWIERALARGPGAPREARALALGALGILALVQEDPETASQVLTESLSLWRELGRPVDEARSLFFLGLLATRRRDVAGLEHIVSAVAPLTPKIQTSTWRHSELVLKGLLARIAGDLDAANLLLERSLKAYRELGFVWGVAWLQGIMSSVALDQEDYPRSLALRQESLRVFWDHGDIASVGAVLLDIAQVAAVLGQAESAARLVGVAERIRETTGILISGEAFRDEPARSVRLDGLDPAVIAAGIAAGRAMTTGAGVEEALALTAAATEPHRPGATGALGGGEGTAFKLTPREREVLRVLASGRATNRELAEALSISPKTAGNHVDNILAKLGVSSRVAAVALAAREGID